MDNKSSEKVVSKRGTQDGNEPKSGSYKKQRTNTDASIPDDSIKDSVVEKDLPVSPKTDLVHSVKNVYGKDGENTVSHESSDASVPKDDPLEKDGMNNGSDESSDTSVPNDDPLEKDGMNNGSEESPDTSVPNDDPLEKDGDNTGSDEPSDASVPEDNTLEKVKVHEVLLERHINCSNCLNDVTKVLQKVDQIATVTETDNGQLTATVIGSEVNAAFMQRRFDEESRLSVIVKEVEVNCDELLESDGSDDKGSNLLDDSSSFPQDKSFDQEEFSRFCKTFKVQVSKSVGGTFGQLYNETYAGVVRITVDGSKHMSDMTGFVVCQTKKNVFILTAAHGLHGFSRSNIEIFVINPDFKRFPAKVLYESTNMDFCVMTVETNLKGNFTVLKTSDELDFLEDIFSISCQGYPFVTDEEMLGVSANLKYLVNTMWFSASQGHIANPFVVEVNPNYLNGQYIHVSGASLGHGASGCPVMNMKGEVIGIYNASTSNKEVDGNVCHWVLGMASVRESLVEFFDVGKEMEGSTSFSKLFRKAEKKKVQCVSDNI